VSGTPARVSATASTTGGPLLPFGYPVLWRRVDSSGMDNVTLLLLLLLVLAVRSHGSGD
jgi:hypothetical protein